MTWQQWVMVAWTLAMAGVVGWVAAVLCSRGRSGLDARPAEVPDGLRWASTPVTPPPSRSGEASRIAPDRHQFDHLARPVPPGRAWHVFTPLRPDQVGGPEFVAARVIEGHAVARLPVSRPAVSHRRPALTGVVEAVGYVVGRLGAGR